MIEVRATPVIEARECGGWELLFIAKDAFDCTTPFRAMLAEMVEALGGPGRAKLALPPYFDDEDFVSGTLTCGGHTLGVYYEYSLGILSLGSDGRDALSDAAAHILPRVRVVPRCDGEEKIVTVTLFCHSERG